MDTAKKFFYGAFVLAITVFLIYIGMNIFRKATYTTDIIMSEQEMTEQTVEEYAIMRYDGYAISGASAIAYIKTIVQKYDVVVDVSTPDGAFSCTDQSLFSEFRDISSPYYINPMKQYEVNVLRDSNDVIEKVEIVYSP